MGHQEEIAPNGKTGTLWTAVAHIFTAVVGAGVLGLPNSIAWLGWVAGPICLLAFFAISMWSSHLLAQLYRVDNIEFSRYHHAVRHLLGERGALAVAAFQCMNLVLTCIAYSITGAIAMRTIARYLNPGSNIKEWQLVLVMGAAELVLSQIPSLEEIWWVSILGTASSLGYVFIALVLGCVYGKNRLGSVGGRPGTSQADKAFGVLNALGNIAFAFGFAQVLLEVQNTLKQPPCAEGTMRRAISIAVSGAFLFYFSSALSCYAALGNDVPGEVLEGFEQAPDWVLVAANFFIVIHMVTAWQVWAQPTYETIESNVKAYMLKRRQRLAGPAVSTAGPTGKDASSDAAVGGASTVAPAAAAAAVSSPGMGSPFDAPHAPVRELTPEEAHKLGAELHEAHFADLHKLPAVMEAGGEGMLEMEGTLSGAQLGLADSTGLRSCRLSIRGSGASIVINTDPIPDLLPPGGWHHKHRPSTSSLHSVDFAGGHTHAHAHPLAPHSLDGSVGHGHMGRRGSGMSQLSLKLGRSSMYHLDTGAANEHVPLNDQGYYLPVWQRLVIRSTFVLLCTVIACVMPFFNAVVGLVGAVTFYPLTIGFPFAMYAKVHKPAKPVLTLMKVVGGVMLLVAAAATIASVQNIVDSMSTYKFFD